MSCIDHALAVINRSIPPQMRNHAFNTKEPWELNHYVSIDSKITALVINNIVIRDSDLRSAQTINLDMSKCKCMYIPNQGYVVTIPNELLNGRTITSPMSVSYSNNVNTIHGDPSSSSLIGKLVSDYGAAVRGPEAVGCTDLRLLSPNMVLVQDLSTSANFSTMICRVSNDANMANINPANWDIFAHLCVLATKMYIYNNCDFELDEGAIRNGVSMTAFRKRLDSYETAEVEYKTYYDDVWVATMNINDKTTSRRLYTLISNPSCAY